MTLRTNGRWLHKTKESETLLDAYEYALKLGTAGGDFRDAIVDAMTENLDDWGLIYWFS